MSVTIYSFRHTGVIEIFKRKGSLTNLQRVTVHCFVALTLAVTFGGGFLFLVTC